MRSIEQRVIFVTGSTDGLGRVVAEEAAGTGAAVLLHGRDRGRGDRALHEVRLASGSQGHHLYLADFSSLEEVRRLAREVEAEHERLDVVINNAGIGPGRRGSGRELSGDGYELRFQVNYLAGFLLTALLLPLLRRSAPARVVNVASVGQTAVDFDNLMLERGYDGWRAYQQSKLAQVMFTLELAVRLEGSAVTVNALHPATLMGTKMVSEASLTPMSTVEEGAQATLRLATAPEFDGVSGRYYEGTRQARAHPQAYDSGARRRLWDLSEELCGLER